MNRTEILVKLNEIFQDVLDDASVVVSESTVAKKDVEGWDSLAHITLIAAIEDEFNFKFDIKEVVKTKNIKDMIDIIERKV
jgi:acyl carrier protein